MDNVISIPRPVEIHHLTVDAERTPPTQEEQSRIEAIGLELLSTGKIKALTPAWMRTIRALLMAGDRPIRLNRTTCKMSWTQIRHFDVLVSSGVLSRANDPETGRQIVTLSKETKAFLGVIVDD